MFKKTKEQLKRYREDNMNKALEITAYHRENEQLKYKLHNITMWIKSFDHLNGNPFSLLNKIKDEAKYE